MCCKKHVLDFDDFLAIPGCKTGKHVFASKASAEVSVGLAIYRQIVSTQNATETSGILG